MLARLETIFRGLPHSEYKITSAESRHYNCIAFAAGETKRWWWPIGAYWPANIPREETISCFVLAFQTLGYLPCDEGTLEADFEKIALYADENNVPTHMARQLHNGLWVSKCGSLEDIEHAELDALSEYGVVVKFLKRPVQKNSRNDQQAENKEH